MQIFLREHETEDRWFIQEIAHQKMEPGTTNANPVTTDFCLTNSFDTKSSVYEGFFHLMGVIKKLLLVMGI